MKKQTQNQTQATEKKSNVKVGNLIKSILLGPVITSLAIAILYIAWWGLSKVFYTLHNWILVTVEPWVKEAWPYVLGIWAFVLITAVAYNMLTSKKNESEEKMDDIPYNNEYDHMYDLSDEDAF